MQANARVGVGRLLIAMVLLVVATYGVARLCLGSTLELAQGRAPLAGTAQPWTLDRLVADLASALLLVAVAGLTLVIALMVLSALAAQRAPALAAVCARLTPATGRRLVTTALGLGLGLPTVAAAPSYAVGDHAPTCHASCHTRPGDLSGLGYPDLPASPRPATAGSARVTVRAGDSLWRIAEARLPDAAAPEQIAASTWRLYVANRTAIGTDPDLIFPGMSLLIPEGSP